jgi:hypothetical protein
LVPTIYITHVKGHQDQTGAQELPMEALLNIEADRQATANMQIQDSQEIHTHHYSTKLYIQGKQVTSNHSKIIREEYHTQAIKSYLQHCNGWSNTTFEDVWWKAFGQAIHQLPMGKKTTIQKYLHNKIPYNQQEHRYYPYLAEYCRPCINVIKTQDHTIQCAQCEERQKFRKNFILILQSYLVDNHTNKITVRMIIHQISNWVHNQPLSSLQEIAPDASPDQQVAFEAQTKIGWHNILKGRLSLQWKKLYTNDRVQAPKDRPCLPDPDTRGETLLK